MGATDTGNMVQDQHPGSQKRHCRRRCAGHRTRHRRSHGRDDGGGQQTPIWPDSLFRSVTLLTTAIAKEMSYAGGLQRQALFSIALVLFVFIMLINVVLNVY